MFTTKNELIEKLPGVPPHCIVLTRGTDQGETETPHFIDVFARTKEQAQSAVNLDGSYHYENGVHVVTFLNADA